jgi:hypothetical protein
MDSFDQVEIQCSHLHHPHQDLGSQQLNQLVVLDCCWVMGLDIGLAQV